MTKKNAPKTETPAETPAETPVVKLTDIDDVNFYETWNDTVTEEGTGTIGDVANALGITIDDENRAKIHQAMSQRASNYRKALNANADAVAAGLTLHKPKGRGRKKGEKMSTTVQSLLDILAKK